MSQKTSVVDKFNVFGSMESRDRRRPQKNASHYRRKRYAMWAKNAIGGFDNRTPLILCKKCDRWILYHGEDKISCPVWSGAYGHALNTWTPGNQRVTVASKLIYRCGIPGCHHDTDVAGLTYIGYFMCEQCSFVPASGDKVELGWQPVLKMVDHHAIDESVMQTFPVNQFNSVIQPIMDDHPELIDQVNSLASSPNNGLFVAFQVMRNYLNGRDEVYITIVLCEKCKVWNEYLWSRDFQCYNCNQNIQVNNLADKKYGTTSRAVYEFGIFCKNCTKPGLAPRFNLHRRGDNFRQCPRCSSPVVPDEDGFIEMRRRVKHVPEFDGENSAQSIVRLRWPINRFLYKLVGRRDQLADPNEPEDHMSWQGAAASAVPSSSNKRARDVYEEDDYDHDDDEYGIHLYCGGIVFNDFAEGSEQPKKIRGSFSDTTSRDWFKRVDRVVALDIEMLMRKNMHPIPLVVSLYGKGGYEASPIGDLMCNQIIKCPVPLKPNFYRLWKTGLTQDHITGSKDKIDRDELMDWLRGYCKDRLIIHHGDQDLISLGIDDSRARQLEQEWDCSFLDTNKLFLDDAGQGISVSRLASHFLNQSQIEPHTCNEDAKLLYMIFQEAVAKIDPPPTVFRLSVPKIYDREQSFFVTCPCHLNYRCDCPCKFIYPNFPQACKTCRCEGCKKIMKNRALNPLVKSEGEMWLLIRSLSR